MAMPPEQMRLVTSLEGWLSEEEAEHLYDLAREVTDGCIVEVGSYRGRSTTALAYGAAAGSGAKLYAIEPHEAFTGIYGGGFGGPDRELFFRNMIAVGVAAQVRLVNLSSEVVAPGWREPVALLWIDGDHRYEGVRRDIDVWRPHLTDKAVVVFDDALDRDIGPAWVIDELAAEGWSRGPVVGKTATLYPDGREPQG